MPDTSFLSQAGAYQDALLRQTYLANAVVHLFKQGITPDPSTTLATLLANECDFDNYSSKTVTAWNEIVAAGATAYLLYGPQLTWTWAHVSADVGNMVAGHFVVSAAGDLADVVIYATPIPMQGPLQAVIKTPSELIQN